MITNFEEHYEEESAAMVWMCTPPPIPIVKATH